MDLRRKLALLDGSGLRAGSVSARGFAPAARPSEAPHAAPPNVARMPSADVGLASDLAPVSSAALGRALNAARTITDVHLSRGIARVPSAEMRLASGAEGRAVQPASPVPGAPLMDRLRRGLAELDTRRVAREGPVRLRSPRPFPAEPRETPYGILHVRERLLDSSHRHGRARVGAALDAEGAIVAALALDPALAEIDPRTMLLLDTETTGLSGGTGTLPFVVGLGWFDEGRLRMMQLLLRRPGEERPILAVLAERMARASCVVTYNGKTFDWPLLRSRYVMNRLRAPQPLPHIDLLHCARRVFRHHTRGVRLVELEEALLGHYRSGDIPGQEIPERYFRYLRCGDGSLLAPVLEHNAQDVVLLAALLGLMAHEFRTVSAGDPRTQLGYAGVAERAGDARRALEFAIAADSSGDCAIRSEALLLAARVSRRRADDRSAAEFLQRAVPVAAGELLSRIHLELAKLYEHRLDDLGRALDHARHTGLAEGAARQRRRLERLERRTGRSPSARAHSGRSSAPH